MSRNEAKEALDILAGSRLTQNEDGSITVSEGTLATLLGFDLAAKVSSRNAKIGL